MVVDKGKRCKIPEQGEEVPDHIDSKLLLSIEKLQEIQDELEKVGISPFFKVNEEASEKELEVEQKYNDMRRPVYKRRNDIIKYIPDFWFTAFLSHPALVDLLSKEDQKIFKFLSSLDVEDFKDVKFGYSITFNFSLNPYFEDMSLKKTYSFLDDGTTSIIGTTIRWKDRRNTADGDAHVTNGSKRSFPEESFFSWFGETTKKDISEGFSDEVAEIIKEDLWPNPLKYFNNEAEEVDFEGNEDDDEKGTEFDDEDDEQEGDEEEEDDN